jgi:hypothetical protein
MQFFISFLIDFTKIMVFETKNDIWYGHQGFRGVFGHVAVLGCESPEADWDQKASATIDIKKIKRPLKCLQKARFLTFCMEECKGPCDQFTLHLWPVRPWDCPYSVPYKDSPEPC